MARASWILSVGLAVLAGCPPAQPDVLRCGVTVQDALVACPSQRALTAHLRERWGLAPRVTLTTRCVPGRFGSAGWLIDAIAVDGGKTAAATFVLQPSCGALSDAALRTTPPIDASYEAIDLDGDGVDEVVAQRRDIEPGGTSTSIEALRVGGGRLARAGKVRIAYDGVDPDLAGRPAVRCTGTARYVARPGGGWLVEIAATRSEISELCLSDGVHRFELGIHGLRRR